MSRRNHFGHDAGIVVRADEIATAILMGLKICFRFICQGKTSRYSLMLYPTRPCRSPPTITERATFPEGSVHKFPAKSSPQGTFCEMQVSGMLAASYAFVAPSCDLWPARGSRFLVGPTLGVGTKAGEKKTD